MSDKKLRALENFEIELKELLNFYKVSSAYLESLKTVDIWEQEGIKKKSTEIDQLINLGAPNHRFRVKEFQSNLPFISRELIFIRIISALEVFLIESVKDVFKQTTVPFLDNKTRLDLGQAEALSFKSISNLRNKILHKETRPLSSVGYEKVVKYYKQRLNIDIASVSPGINKIKYYHDIRHILVHRLGKTDKQFKASYNYKKTYIKISEKLIIEVIDHIYLYGQKISEKITALIDSHCQPKVFKEFSGLRYLIKFHSQIKDKIKFMQPDYHFWCGDEIYFLKDLSSKITNEDGEIEMEIWGEKDVIKSYINNIRMRLKTSTYFSNLLIKYIKHPKELDESIVLEVDKALPEQPWETGIHKTIAAQFNISNTVAALIIDELINRGVFKPQKDGEISE